MIIDTKPIDDEQLLRQFVDRLVDLNILPKNEVKIYAQLLETPNITGKELSQILGIPDSKVYPSLVELTNKQLVNSSGTRPAKYWIEDEHALFNYLKGIKEEEMHRFQDTLNKLMELQKEIRKRNPNFQGNVPLLHLKENQIPHQVLSIFMQAKESATLILSPPFFSIIPFNTFSTRYLSKLGDVEGNFAFPAEEASNLLQTVSGAHKKLNSGQKKVKDLFDKGKLSIKLSKLEMGSYIVIDSEMAIQVFHTPIDTFALVTYDKQFINLVERQFYMNEFTAPLI